MKILQSVKSIRHRRGYVGRDVMSRLRKRAIRKTLTFLYHLMRI